jgi:hypothetical protein
MKTSILNSKAQLKINIQLKILFRNILSNYTIYKQLKPLPTIDKQEQSNLLYYIGS